MNTRLFAHLPLALVLALTASTASAQPKWENYYPADFKVPAADMQKLTEQFKKLLPSPDWTVTASGNSINVASDKPIFIATLAYNETDFVKYRPPYRLQLSVSPLLKQADYDQLLLKNRAIQQEIRAALRKHGVDELIESRGFSEADKQSESFRAYAAETKHLVYSSLPTFTSPDYSLTLNGTSTWGLSAVGVQVGVQADVKAQSQEFETAILKSFRVYLPPTAKGANPFVRTDINAFGVEVPPTPEGYRYSYSRLEEIPHTAQPQPTAP